MKNCLWLMCSLVFLSGCQNVTETPKDPNSLAWSTGDANNIKDWRGVGVSKNGKNFIVSQEKGVIYTAKL